MTATLAWTVVIPVRGTPDAKSRLRSSPALSLAIALDTVEAALAVARVVVVTASATPGDFAALGAIVVPDPGRGLNAAVTAGIEAAGSGAVAVLLGDVPALAPNELADALGRAEAAPLAMVPDADGTGTVLITALPGAQHAPAFGESSRQRHHAVGYIELQLPVDSGLRRDVDTPQHLRDLGQRLGPRTRAELAMQRG